MVNILSGIVLTEDDKTVSEIYNKITCNRHRSTGSGFLMSIHGIMIMLMEINLCGHIVLSLLITK